MDKLVYKTKISFLGIIITGLILVFIIYVLISNPINLTISLLCIVGLLTVLLPQFSASTVIEFYDNYFKIRYPLLFFLPNYRNQIFKYCDVNKVEYRYRLREPNRLEVKLKNEHKKWFWCRFRYFSHDKVKIGKLFSDYSIEFQYRRFGKIKMFNQKEWIKISDN